MRLHDRRAGGACGPRRTERYALTLLPLRDGMLQGDALHRKPAEADCMRRTVCGDNCDAGSKKEPSPHIWHMFCGPEERLVASMLQKAAKAGSPRYLIYVPDPSTDQVGLQRLASVKEYKSIEPGCLVRATGGVDDRVHLTAPLLSTILRRCPMHAPTGRAKSSLLCVPIVPAFSK